MGMKDIVSLTQLAKKLDNLKRKYKVCSLFMTVLVVDVVSSHMLKSCLSNDAYVMSLAVLESTCSRESCLSLSPFHSSGA